MTASGAYWFAHFRSVFNPQVSITVARRAAYWDGRNDAGERVASGLYFYQLTTPSFHQITAACSYKVGSNE